MITAYRMTGEAFQISAEGFMTGEAEPVVRRGLAAIACAHRAKDRLPGKAGESLASLARVTTFVQSVPLMQADDDARTLCHTISRDKQSLSAHVAVLARYIRFLFGASLGPNSVEQDATIKIFSIAPAVFLPPTLVASIYGMTFHVMPETNWAPGDPLSLAAMLVSAIVPYYFFRWKGWLQGA